MKIEGQTSSHALCLWGDQCKPFFMLSFQLILKKKKIVGNWNCRQSWETHSSCIVSIDQSIVEETSQ